VRDGFLPPEDLSLSIPLDWRVACKVIRRASLCGVDPYFDDEAQLMISGYGLFNAGVIDDHLRVQNAANRETTAELDDELSEQLAKKCFMLLYANLLAHYIGQPGPKTVAHALARDHLEGAQNWLMQNHVAWTIPGSSTVN
jgi:hypothetical protein